MINWTRHVVTHDVLFNFAAKPPFNLSWSDCSKAFFRDEVLTYKSWNEIELHEIEDLDKLGYRIMTLFMHQQDLDHMIVLSD